MTPDPSVRPVSPPQPSSVATAAALTFGVGLIALGALAFVYVVAASVAPVALLGTFIAIGGLVEIVSAFRAGAGERLLRLLSGALAFAVGVLVFSRPLAGVAAIGFLLTGYFFASGLFRGVVALLERPARWGWDLVYAVVSIGLAIYLLARWPASSFFVLGTLVGIELVSRGVAIIGLSLAFRSSPRQARRGAAA